MPQRLGRLEEEVQGLRRDVRSLRGLVERLMTDQARFSTWMMSCMAQLMDASWLTYQAFDGTFRGSSPSAFQRRSKQRTGEANTSAAQQDPQIKSGSKFSTIVHEYDTEPSRIFTLNARIGKRDDFKCVEAEDKSNLKTLLVEVWEQNRVLAGFGIGGKIGKSFKDENGEEVDAHMYRSMIGSLMYLTSSRPGIIFAVYLKDQPKLGLWYPKDSPFDLVAYTDSDYTRARLDRKSTIGVDGKKIIVTESIVRRDLQLEDAKDADEDITLVNVQDDADNEIFDVDTLTGDELFAEQEVADKDVNLTVDEVTLAQALAALKSVKPKIKGVVIEEPSVPISVVNASIKVSAATTTTATIPTPRKGIVITELGIPTVMRSSQQPSHVKVQDKGKGIMIDEEERIARAEEEKIDEANITWDEIQVKVDANYQLAERLQAK
ncbi:hypothetical protein Tco_0773650 [Tanacetum coccineum]|uniref:Uncharacterized protein n=1 Tax=Tanacetum coccineum TaxID=301880 RepID=A0ABQ4ZLE5_9ASTR